MTQCHSNAYLCIYRERQREREIYAHKHDNLKPTMLCTFFWDYMFRPDWDSFRSQTKMAADHCEYTLHQHLFSNLMGSRVIKRKQLWKQFVLKQMLCKHDAINELPTHPLRARLVFSTLKERGPWKYCAALALNILSATECQAPSACVCVGTCVWIYSQHHWNAWPWRNLCGPSAILVPGILPLRSRLCVLCARCFRLALAKCSAISHEL